METHDSGATSKLSGKTGAARKVFVLSFFFFLSQLDSHFPGKKNNKSHHFAMWELWF
jgi:hypothetical protein